MENKGRREEGNSEGKDPQASSDEIWIYGERDLIHLYSLMTVLGCVLEQRRGEDFLFIMNLADPEFVIDEDLCHLWTAEISFFLFDAHLPHVEVCRLAYHLPVLH